MGSDIDALLTEAARLDSANRSALRELKSALNDERGSIVLQRAGTYEMKQALLELKGARLAKPHTLDTQRPWMKHWLLALDIPRPDLEKLASPEPVTKPFIEAAKLAEIPDFGYVSKQLLEENFCVYDDFWPREKCIKMRDELRAMYDRDELEDGKIGDLVDGKPTHVSTWRSDLVTWREDSDPALPFSGEYQTERADVFVQKVAKFLEMTCPEYTWEARRRSRMMCTIYPGNGTHYIKHYDNPNENSRVLTLILYLNEDWKPEDGGFIRIGEPYQALEDDIRFVSIAPLMGRALMFWSDKRCPHEVSPAYDFRYAITVWFHGTEKGCGHAGPAAAHKKTPPAAKKEDAMR